jgi:hypothetical protein
MKDAAAKIAELERRLERISPVYQFGKGGEVWISRFAASKTEWLALNEESRKQMVQYWADTVLSELNYHTAQSGNVPGRA